MVVAGWVQEFVFTTHVDDLFAHPNHTLPDVLITDTKKDLNVYKKHLADDETASCCVKPSSGLDRRHEQMATAGGTVSQVAQFDDVDYNEYAGAFKIYAVLAA